ncbi:conserved oligomeric Golgi complex subunit 5-like [Tigriopus californicus]|nr:conserved oligomeric Golgi complex subunit 5-like [Tigriopus californicus]|eukprot:TCALIF_00821-PA protein Name:"Similar to COG5 Conserved oligomeric Golgi complex subunit 5 (Homo sapiens)" AED:0.24 eAED:0.24 QI:0/-1/0/1/-1/1/1/0/813
MDVEEIKASLLAPADFDVEKHASELFQSGQDIGTYMNNLNQAEHELDGNIQDQVSNHYEDLLSQATSVEHLEIHLDMMQSHMHTLVATSERLKTKVREPYRMMSTQVLTLSRLQETCDLLRRIIRIVQLGKRLQSQLQAGPSELTKAALSLQELTELWVPELNNVDIIEQDQRVVLHAKTDVERNADSILTRGLDSRNQNQIGIALQVFQNLSMLELKLDARLQEEVAKVRTKLQDCLSMSKITQAVEVSGNYSNASSGTANPPNGGIGGGGGGGGAGPGKATIPATGNMATFRAVMWNNFESCLDFVFIKAGELLCLQRLLCKKRDAVSHLTFMDLLPEPKNEILAKFWSEIVDILNKQLRFATGESNFLRQALEGEFPKLLRLFNDLWLRLHAMGKEIPFEESEKFTNPFQAAKPQDELRNTMESFERAYLSRSLSRLFDPVNLMFSSGETPIKGEIKQVLKGIASELNIALVDTQLCHTVCKNVAKTIQLTCVKCEGILVTDGEASQVIGYPTEGQKKNVSIVNCLYEFKQGMETILSTIALGKSSVQVIRQALLDVDKQAKAAVEPLMNSISDAIEAIILTIHNEDFSGSGEDQTGSAVSNPAAKPCSLYMKELQSFLSRVSADYLQAFECHELLAECVLPVVRRCVDQFVVDASLIRPLGTEGQMRLASDCAQLEMALEPLSGQLNASLLGKSYETLRSFRSMLFFNPEDILSSPVLGKSLPFSIALHFLYAKAPKELQSPHESTGWSLSRYSSWLSDHPNELDRLQLIQGSLESYVAGTRQRGEKSYAHPYPIMLQVLEQGLTSLKG